MMVPDEHTRGQSRIRDRRELLNAIRYPLHNDGVWRALPHDPPNWQVVYRCYRALRDDGTRRRVHDALRVTDLERAGERPSRPLAASIARR